MKVKNMIQVSTFGEHAVIYDSEVFDTSMSWSSIQEYKEKTGLFPEGCIVVTQDQFHIINELIRQERVDAFETGFEEGLQKNKNK